MTAEKLKEAQKLADDILELEKLLKCFPTFYIGGTSYSTSDLYQVCEVDDAATYQGIRTALNNRLDKLKSQFELL